MISRSAVKGPRVEPVGRNYWFHESANSWGAGQIGGSCIELKASRQHILLDVGMPLADLDDSGISVPVVDPTSLCGIVISHQFGIIMACCH